MNPPSFIRSCLGRGWLVVAALAVWIGTGARPLSPSARAAEPEGTPRARLLEAILTEDAARQTLLIGSLGTDDDALVSQALSAWRGGGLYLLETNSTRRVLLLDAQLDSEGRARAVDLSSGEPVHDAAGNPVLFLPADLNAVDADAKLRRVIKAALDVRALANPNPRMRRDAVMKLGQEQRLEHAELLEARLPAEREAEVRRALEESLAVIRLVDTDPARRLAAVRKLDALRAMASLSFLKKLEADTVAKPEAFSEETRLAVRAAVRNIEDHIRWVGFWGTAFRGLSLAAVLLVAALGLAITFGLMGVINMAHGEIMMVGAYAAYVTQNVFQSWFGAVGRGFDCYFIAALVVSFFAAAVAGLVLERGIIRFLYRRPLESLLATWGVSLVMQQLFRSVFGAANVQVSSPSWLSGSLSLSDVGLAYNRIFVIGFAFFVVALTWALLTRTSLGLQIRAVMQNRTMASALGVRTERVNMMTFAFGSGLAGMAGACLSQIGNVGPSLGQNHIVDCFMIVVLGGVGNLIGTICASLGVGVTNQVLEPWLGAVLSKITVLGAIILFLQWRPAGIFVTRSRSLEG